MTVECDVSKGLIGTWDSFNIIDVKIDASKVTYKLNTTVLVEMKISSEEVGEIDLSGYLRKNVHHFNNNRNKKLTR